MPSFEQTRARGEQALALALHIRQRLRERDRVVPPNDAIRLREAEEMLDELACAVTVLALAVMRVEE